MDEVLVIDKKGSIFVQKLTQMSKKLPEIDIEKLGVNPFSNELVVEATKIEESGKWIMAEDGEMLPSHQLVERQKFTRIYHYDGARERWLNLSAGALRMMTYIIFTIDGSKDWIRIIPETYEKKTGKGSLNTYKRAVEELIRYGYLTPTIYKYTYWINPSQLFAGNRINKYEKRVVVKTIKQ